MLSDSCILKLDHLIFDNISFRRTGFKNNNAINYQFKFGFDSSKINNIIVHIRLIAIKDGEYNITIDTSGYFSCNADPEQVTMMTKQNAVAIVFPYIRSQLTLLSAQPEMNPIVLPPLNIAKIVKDAEESSKENT